MSEFFELETLQEVRHRRRHRINLSRHVYNEDEFSQSFIQRTDFVSANSALYAPSLSSTLRRNCCPTKCTVASILTSWWPILSWLPKYNVREDLPQDITGGLTVGIMHVPQGLAYAMLASLPAVTGLYTAFVPILVYMLMGTSKHLSLGTFAVVCLMVGRVCEREVAGMSAPATSVMPTVPTTAATTVNVSNLAGMVVKQEQQSSDMSWEDAKKLEVAITLSLLIGFLKLLMGLCKMGFVAVYLSDPLISGFTTGAAVLVFTSQVKHILGLKVPRYSGLFAVVKAYIFIFKNIPACVPGAIIIGIVSILVLVVLKYLDVKVKEKIKAPIPAELVCVIIGTVISYYADINEKYQVEVLGDIPKGLPPLSIPSFSLMANIIPDAFVISIVMFATNVSLAKMFGKKHKYAIDPNQELVAYGMANIVGSFFSSFPVSASLSRSAVQESLARTELCTIPVVFIIVLVLLFIAPLFYHLPKAILAAIIIVALRGLFKQFKQLKHLWTICKSDALVWFAVWIGVVLLGIDIGLAVGVMVALLTVIYRSSRPRVTLLGQIPGTGIYRDITKIPAAQEIPGVKIFRCDSPLFYANVEYFRAALIECTRVDPQNSLPHLMRSKDFKKQTPPSSGDSSPVINAHGDVAITVTTTPPREVDVGPEVKWKGMKVVNQDDSSNETTDSDSDISPNVHTIIVDCSTFNFIDTQGVQVLIQLALEFEKVGVHFYLANCIYSIRNMLEKANFTSEIGAHHLFISVHDAVVHAVGTRGVESVISLLSDFEGSTSAGAKQVHTTAASGEADDS